MTEVEDDGNGGGPMEDGRRWWKRIWSRAVLFDVFKEGIFFVAVKNDSTYWEEEEDNFFGMI